MARFAAVDPGGPSSNSPRRRLPKRTRPNVYISSSSSDSYSEESLTLQRRRHASSFSSDSSSPIRRRRMVPPNPTLNLFAAIAPEDSDSDEESDIGDSIQYDIENPTQSETTDVVLSDTDLLNCPICLDPLSPPVYQCVSGHLVCKSCFEKIAKCPSCNVTIGSNRCTAIEKILESAEVKCRNRQYGCRVNLTYDQKLEHEKSCQFVACSCPRDGCDYVARSELLNRHFSLQHSGSVYEFRINVTTGISLPKDVNKVFLQERRGSALFVLNRSVVTLGSLFSVVCVAPTSSGAKYSFRLTASAGINSICLTSSVVVTPKCSSQSPKKNCLLVTSDFADHYECLELQLLLQKIE